MIRFAGVIVDGSEDRVSERVRWRSVPYNGEVPPMSKPMTLAPCWLLREEFPTSVRTTSMGSVAGSAALSDSSLRLETNEVTRSHKDIDRTCGTIFLRAVQNILSRGPNYYSRIAVMLSEKGAKASSHRIELWTSRLSVTITVERSNQLSYEDKLLRGAMWNNYICH